MGPSLLFSLKTSPLKPLSLLFAGLLLAPMAGAADSWWPDIRVEVKASTGRGEAKPEGDGGGAHGVFKESDSPKEYDVTTFGKAERVKRNGRHSVILKYDGKDSFAQRCERLQSQ